MWRIILVLGPAALGSMFWSLPARGDVPATSDPVPQAVTAAGNWEERPGAEGPGELWTDWLLDRLTMPLGPAYLKISPRWT